ncbi:hypothetical protein BH11ACT6_BH11ACT6_50160 [soil metagenome]
MAGEFEVAGRLSEGTAALDNTQTYVSASTVRGYRHPDLTLHSRQIHDWYGTEDGLDLRALDADCAALRAAAQLASEALGCLRAQLPALAAAWDGDGSRAATDFVTRHIQRAEQMVNAVEGAALASARLRDELWRIVDRKVDATTSLDDRTAAQRAGWLTAARTVIAGGSAEEAATVVDAEITPFVRTVVGGEWLATMRSAVGAVDAAYRAAAEPLLSRPPVRFDIPGALVPVSAPRGVAAAVAAPPTAPAGLISSPTSLPGALPPGPVPPLVAPMDAPPLPSPAGPPPNSVAPLPNPMESMAGPVPAPLGAPAPLGGPAAGGGQGLGGLPGRFADALGGLFDPGSSPGDLPATDELEPPDIPGDVGLDDDDLDDDNLDDDNLEEEPVDVPPDEATGQAEADQADNAGNADEVAVSGDPPAEACPEEDIPEPVEPEILSAPEAALPPLPTPAVDPSATPCEIAADELPQVGQ